jgi:hypothetical protein
MATARLGLSLLSENQSSAEVTFNESIYILDALVQASAIDRIFDADSAAAVTGNVYLIHGGTPAGGDAWEGKLNNIAYYLTDTWKFVAPKEGMMIWVNDEDVWYYYTGSDWGVAPLKTDSISGHIVVPEDKDYTLDLRAAQAYNLTELSGKTSAGTCTIQLKKNGSLVGSSRAVTSTIANTTTSFPVAVAENDKIELIVSSTSSATDLAFGVKISL